MHQSDFSFSTLGETGLPSTFIRFTVLATPAASHSSNGPISQLKPIFMARSISTTESAISPMRLAAYVHRSDKADQRKTPALSFDGVSSIWSRSGRFSTDRKSTRLNSSHLGI